MKATKGRSVELLRTAVLTSIDSPPAQFDDIKHKFIYIPARHLPALNPNAMLVTGIRGAGKSFWWYALQQEELRKLVLPAVTRIDLGFGQNPSNRYPSPDELTQLIERHGSARVIWRTVIVRAIDPGFDAGESWAEWVSSVAGNPSRVADLLRAHDEGMAQKGQMHVFLFDALDRSAERRADREQLLAGLLQVVLELRSYRALRAKVFARPDMLDAPGVRGFPDASKVLASRVSLDWDTKDLYGLLFQYLGNAGEDEAAEAFRVLAQGQRNVMDEGDVWEVPEQLRDDEGRQKQVFEAIAGPYMGTNARRGRTYTWVPNHLADGLGAVSPRSFLAAIRRAAEDPPKHDYALHWSGLHEGVRYASTIRADEIREDLPWAHDALSFLKDLVVPCSRKKVVSAWKQKRFLEESGSGLENYEAVLEELRRAGLLKLLPDERINIPDVYRLGFGLRRKGGFAPRQSC